ncbi:MAG TPA: hypothetical protein VM282_15285 [Acidimicrobiales bacterium]|nr:hypothetical protein [Acidimicrobiales bacterium]
MTTTTSAFAAPSRPSAAHRAARRGADDPIHLLPVPVRQLRLEVLLWALRQGQPVEAEALTCILLAKDTHDDPYTVWTAESVRRLLWIDIVALCEALERPPPELVALTMWTLLDFLAATDRFAGGSDPLELLREPLIDSGGFALRRRVASSRRRHPAAR